MAPALDNNNNVIDFSADNYSISLRFKQNVTGQRRNNGTRDVEIIVSLNYRSIFRRILEIPFINSGINFMLNWSEKSSYMLVLW